MPKDNKENAQDIEYLTTKEVAAYLRLNEKKVYALVSEGRMPAARISGKWLFPKHLIDRWVEQHTIFPVNSVLESMLDEMIVIQGSDDWLFSKVVKHFQAARGIPVVSASTGCIAGLAAVGANCGRTLTENLEAIQKMRGALPEATLMAKPNAGLPRMEGGDSVYDVTPEIMADYAQKFAALDVKIFGGCCGSTPDHIEAAARALRS